MKKAIIFAVFSVLLGTQTLLPSLALAATAPTLSKPTVACLSGKPQVTVSWNKVSGATSYSVFRLEQPQTKWLTRYSKVRGVTQIDKYVVNSTTYQYQVKAHFASSVLFSNIVTVTTPNCSTTTAPISPATSTPPVPATPSPTPTPATNEKVISAYITGYGWPDNTPASAAISNGVIHNLAGGTGTYTDPITIAVGHSIINGKDILDYPEGTKFYIPALKRYAIVEDTCGDGKQPQNGPCHTGYQGHPWLDIWVGGQGANTSSVYACEDKITNIHTVIQDPASNYSVVSGPIFNGTCTSLYPETATLN